MEYFEYTVKNHLTGKKSKGIVTSDNIEAAEETRKKNVLIEVYELSNK